MPGLALPSDAFHLGDLIVVPSLNRLVRDGAPEDVEPRVMRVLAVLAQTPGEVVTRAALFDAVWADTVVGDEALTRAVSELRKALGAEASGAVETIRGTGYRLARATEPLALEALATPATSRPPRPAPRRARGGPLVVLALLLAGISLAVALWAAWPRVAPDAATDVRTTLERNSAPPSPEAAENLRSVINGRARPAPRLGGDDPTRLDSTSPYYRPGMSELGVYYDSTTGRYFAFAEDE